MRLQLGFSVVGPWVNREESKFVWLVGYDGNAEDANERYYAPDERAAMDPDPARLVAESTTVWLDPIAIEEKEST